MITYCGLCREQIPLDRQRRGARTCSVECQKAYRAARREEWMKSHCKYCGRRLGRQKSTGNTVPEASAPNGAQ